MTFETVLLRLHVAAIGRFVSFPDKAVGRCWMFFTITNKRSCREAWTTHICSHLTFFLDVENSWIVCRLTLTPAPALCWWPPTVSPAWPRLRSGTRAMAALMLWHSLSIGQALCWLGFVCMEALATTSMKWSCWWRSVERWVLQEVLFL